MGSSNEDSDKANELLAVIKKCAGVTLGEIRKKADVPKITARVESRRVPFAHHAPPITQAQFSQSHGTE
jgi:hypothetical protein